MFLVPASLLGEALRPSDKPANAAAQYAVVAFDIDRVNVCLGRVAENFGETVLFLIPKTNATVEGPWA